MTTLTPKELAAILRNCASDKPSCNADCKLFPECVHSSIHTVDYRAADMIEQLDFLLSQSKLEYDYKCKELETLSKAFDRAADRIAELEELLGKYNTEH